MSFTDQVEAYLVGLSGAAACDGCIADAVITLGPRNANLAARRLVCIGIVQRRRGRCDQCGARKLVTQTRRADQSQQR